MCISQLVAPSAEFKALLDPSVVAYRLTQEAGPNDVHPAERYLVCEASPKRQAEFFGGRACAAGCLEALGVPPAPVGRGPRNMPVWPQGFVGSIAHCASYCAAVAARRGRILSLGIDIEVAFAVEPDLEPLLMTEPEEQALNALNGSNRTQLATVHFSAKEAFFKAQYPLTRLFLDFRAVTVNVERGQFSITLNSPIEKLGPAGQEFAGRFLVTNQHVFTALEIRCVPTPSL